MGCAYAGKLNREFTTSACRRPIAHSENSPTKPPRPDALIQHLPARLILAAMISLSAFFAWLLQLPAWSRLAEINRALLQRTLRILADPDCAALLANDPAFAAELERILQVAEAGVSRAEWLLGHILNGRAARPVASPLRTLPTRSASDPARLHAACLRRALALLARLDDIDARARRIASPLNGLAAHSGSRPDNAARAPATRTLTTRHTHNARTSRAERNTHLNRASRPACARAPPCDPTGARLCGPPPIRF